MHDNPRSIFTRLLSSSLKRNMTVKTAIESDLSRYANALDNIDTHLFCLVDKHEDEEETNKAITLHYEEDYSVHLKIFDESQYYNQVSVYISGDRNKIEFIASNVSKRGKIPNFTEESEYIYEPETKKYYVYRSKTSYAHNAILMLIKTYDENGNLEKNNTYCSRLDKDIVKTKTR